MEIIKLAKHKVHLIWYFISEYSYFMMVVRKRYWNIIVSHIPYYEGVETPEQVALRSHGCLIPGSVQDHVEQGLGLGKVWQCGLEVDEL